MNKAPEIDSQKLQLLGNIIQELNAKYVIAPDVGLDFKPLTFENISEGILNGSQTTWEKFVYTLMLNAARDIVIETCARLKPSEKVALQQQVDEVSHSALLACIASSGYCGCSELSQMAVNELLKHRITPIHQAMIYDPKDLCINHVILLIDTHAPVTPFTRPLQQVTFDPRTIAVDPYFGFAGSFIDYLKHPKFLAWFKRPIDQLMCREIIAVSEYNKHTTQAVNDQIVIINRYTAPYFQLLHRLYQLANFGVFDPNMFVRTIKPRDLSKATKVIPENEVVELICIEMSRITEVEGWRYDCASQTAWLKAAPEKHSIIRKYLSHLGFQVNETRTQKNNLSAITVKPISLAMLHRIPAFKHGQHALEQTSVNASASQTIVPEIVTEQVRPTPQPNYQPVFAAANNAIRSQQSTSIQHKAQSQQG